MNGKQAILARVRNALKTPTDSQVRHHSPPLQTSNLPILASRQFLPPVGPDFRARCDLFAEISGRLKTEFIIVDQLSAVVNSVQRLADQHEWKRIGVHDHPWVNSSLAGIALPQYSTDSSCDVHELESCSAGITGCEALIAQTGSVLVTNRSSGGRALSVLPEHHVVIAHADQMLATMADGFLLLKEKYDGNWPSFLSFITGPSRTADIERVLVLGAHGPKRLTVILVTGKID